MPTPEGYVILNAEEYAAVLRDKEVLELERTDWELERTDWELEKQRLKDQISELQRLLFGAKSERFVPTATPGQLLLELEGLEEVAAAHKKMVSGYERSKAAPGKPHEGRLPIPAHLKRVEKVLEPAEDTTQMEHIGDEVSETLEYTPGELWVRRIVRRKYVRKDSGSGADQSNPVVVAPMPDHAFPRLKAGVSLLSWLVLSKFCDHLPLHRLIQILSRQGVKIPSSTMGDWVKVALERLEVLYAAYKRELLQSSYLQMDETRLKVLEESQKGKAHLGYIWAVYDPVNRLPFFTYLPGRSHHGPYKLLERFEGYLQSDGYSVYELLNRKLPAVTLLNCWAHVRREFYEARSNDEQRAHFALAMMQQLYKVEHDAREKQLSVEEVKALRQKEAKPIYHEMHNWLSAEYGKVLPKSSIGLAMAYALRRWENLGRYLDDGHLEIDNNLVENAIRPIAIGRKNYLFAGDHNAAQRNAMIYTFFAACKQHNVEPNQWLNDVLNRIHSHPINKITELLPQYWRTNSEKTPE